MQPIRVTIRPEDVPAGYEAEAVYKVPEPEELAMSQHGIQIVPSQRGYYAGPRLILTSKRLSLAQRVKDSGWRCPISLAESLVCLQHGKDNGRWGVHMHMLNRYCTPLHHDPLLASVETTAEDYGVVVKLDNDGYPIVEEENKCPTKN